MDKNVGLYGVDNRTILTSVTDGLGPKRESGGHVDGVCKPVLVDTIQTGCDIPRRVVCLGSSGAWVSGIDDVIEAWSMKDKSNVRDIFQTLSGRRPTDLALSPEGRIVYSDHFQRRILKYKNRQVKTVLCFRKWRPSGICYTSSGELLVGMSNADYSEKKIRRYDGKKIRHVIQFDQRGRALFTPGDLAIFVKENKNRDICVVDCQAKVLLILNKAGCVRFKYSGGHVGGDFNPGCLATDSLCRILLTDTGNDVIHVLDRDTRLLGVIDRSHGVTGCVGIAVDGEDRAWVTECHTAKLKVVTVSTRTVVKAHPTQPKSE